MDQSDEFRVDNTVVDTDTESDSEASVQATEGAEQEDSDEFISKLLNGLKLSRSALDHDMSAAAAGLEQLEVSDRSAELQLTMIYHVAVNYNALGQTLGVGMIQTCQGVGSVPMGKAAAAAPELVERSHWLPNLVQKIDSHYLARMYGVLFAARRASNLHSRLGKASETLIKFKKLVIFCESAQTADDILSSLKKGYPRLEGGRWEGKQWVSRCLLNAMKKMSLVELDIRVPDSVTATAQIQRARQLADESCITAAQKSFGKKAAKPHKRPEPGHKKKANKERGAKKMQSAFEANVLGPRKESGVGKRRHSDNPKTRKLKRALKASLHGEANQSVDQQMT